MAEERLKIILFRCGDGDADAAGEVAAVHILVEYAAEGVEYLLCVRVSRRRVRNVGHKYHKFVAADPGYDVAGAEYGADILRQFTQHRVPEHVSIAIVYVFEIINVNDEHCPHVARHHRLKVAFYLFASRILVV